MDSLNTPASLVASQRRTLRFSERDVAAKVGLSIHEYGDIEQHADEIIKVTDLRQVRQLLRVLSLQMDELLQAAGIGSRLEPHQARPPGLPRNELIRASREAGRFPHRSLRKQLAMD
jgi:hypothetical protein